MLLSCCELVWQFAVEHEPELLEVGPPLIEAEPDDRLVDRLVYEFDEHVCLDPLVVTDPAGVRGRCDLLVVPSLDGFRLAALASPLGCVLM